MHPIKTFPNQMQSNFPILFDNELKGFQIIVVAYGSLDFKSTNVFASQM